MSTKTQSPAVKNAGIGENSGAPDASGETSGFGNPAVAFFSVPLAAQASDFRPASQPSGLFSAVAAVSAPSAAVPTASPSASGVTTTAVLKSTAVPSWVGTLQNASIAADMAAADVNGTVTYAGLETLLTDLDAKLVSSKTTLTTSQLSDLKTIAADLNTGMTTSAYLKSVMTSLVAGNAANVSWTGGAASSIALGNLAVGSTATQLSDLIGKWVLGTDLPSSKVSVDGTKFSVSYAASSSPLFGTNGPTASDVNQGYLGDCYLLSSLAEVASQNAGLISSMFTSNGNNTYGVKFYVDGVAQYVTVNNALADNGMAFNYGTDIWASLAEKAYAQLQTGGVVTGNNVNSGNSWTTIGNGGAPECALEEVTGASQITDFMASTTSWHDATYNSSLQQTGYTTSTTTSVFDTLACDLAKGDDLVLSSYTNATDSAGKTTLVASHAMSIYGFDSTTDQFEIRNPWGSESGQTWDTTFEISLSTLLADGDTITVDNVGNLIAAPVLTAQTTAQTWKLGQAVNFSLPANTFTDPLGEQLTYRATLSSGAALPSWLSLNATTGTFTGTVPNTAAGLVIKVTATDTGGTSSSETFSVLTPAAAPVLTAQTANQTWNTGQAVNFTLASGTFTDPQRETLTFTASQSNGSALPTWLNFNGSTDTFSGTAPTTAGSLSLKVTASDTSGLSTSETFAASVAKLTQAIASIPSSGPVSSAPTQLASAASPTLASPTH